MTTVEEFAQIADSPYRVGTTAEFGEFAIHASTMLSFDSRLPPWWSPKRDQAMTAEWKQNAILSALMFPAQTKIASMPVRVVPVDPNIQSHQRQARELTEQFHALSEFGEGLQEMMVRVAEDYFAADNGGFIEVVADGPKDTPIIGTPLGMRHLDTMHVTRMSDPLMPIKYRQGSKSVPFHHSRVMAITQMRSARREKNGVGFCAVSRTIELAAKYQDAINYVRGKMGGRAFKRLLVGKNITGRELINAIAVSTALQQGISGWAVDSIAVGGPELEVNAVDLANFAEFDEQSITYTTMALMALAWGLEFNEAFPMPGSKASEEVALQRSRGRLPAFFVSRFSRLATAKLVPSYLKVEIDFVDDYLDQQREIIADIRARNLQRMVDAGVLTIGAARARLYQDQYISDSSYLTMCLSEGKLPDGTPAIRVLLDPEYGDIILINPLYIVGNADPAMVQSDVRHNIAYIYSLYPQTTAAARHARYQIAIRALQDLAAMYQTPVMLPVPPAPGDTGSQEDVAAPAEEPESEDTGGQPREEPTGQRESKSIFQKANDAFEQYIDSFRQDIYDALARSGGPDDDELTDKMERAMTVAALLALGLGDSEEGELGPEEKEVIDREMALVGAAMAGIIARANAGTDMNPTADRMSNQIWRVYWDVWVHAGVTEAQKEYSWKLGATEKHCEHCLQYSQMGARPASFWKELATTQGHYPRSGALACTGIYCDCSYAES